MNKQSVTFSKFSIFKKDGFNSSAQRLVSQFRGGSIFKLSRDMIANTNYECTPQLDSYHEAK